MSDLSISSCSPVDYDLLQHATDAYMDPDSDGPNCEVLAAISLALENRPGCVI